MEQIAEETHQDHVYFINCKVFEIWDRFSKFSNFVISVSLLRETNVDSQIYSDQERSNRNLFGEDLLEHVSFEKALTCLAVMK